MASMTPVKPTDRRPDAYQEDYFQRVRQRTFPIQAMAPLALLLVVLVDTALTGSALFSGTRWLRLLGCVAMLGALMAVLARVTSVTMHGWVTIALLCAAELSIVFIVTPTREALYWTMPILMVIPVAAAPFWIHLLRAIACCVLCYACAATLLLRTGADLTAALVFLGQATLFTLTSVAVFTSIDRLRRSAYAFQLDLSHQATHDALTGLLSRRRFLELGDAASQAAGARGTRYAVCFMDLDRFKQINDQHGHAAGDFTLARTAGLVLERLPSGALAARMGGEEFVMLLPGFDAAAAVDFAEGLRVAIREQDTQGISATASAGVAVQRQGETFKEVLHRADSALLDAKRHGRDRVELADE